jgi:hypothetical protein
LNNVEKVNATGCLNREAVSGDPAILRSGDPAIRRSCNPAILQTTRVLDLEDQEKTVIYI